MDERNSPTDGGQHRGETGSPAAMSPRAEEDEGRRQSGNGRHLESDHEFDEQTSGSDPGSVDRFSGRSPVALIRQLMADAAVLVRKEAALAAAEINQSVDGLKVAVTSLLSGGAVLHAGILFLLAAAALGLAQVVELWLAVLIVGGIVTLVGIIMLQAGKKKLEPARFKPEHTVDSLRKDKDALRRHTS